MLPYATSAFKTFISSWLPELRHLKSKIQNNPSLLQQKIYDYLDALIDLIPVSDSVKELNTSLKKNAGAVHFPQYYATFFGKLKPHAEQTEENYQSNEAKNLNNILTMKEVNRL